MTTVMECPRCHVPCADDAKLCASCAAPIAARAEKSLERLIDERARAILAEQKAEATRAEEAEARAAAEAAAHAAHEAEHERLRAAVEQTRAALKLNRWSQRAGFRPFLRLLRPSFFGYGTLIAAFCIFGMIPHYLVFPAVSWTPASVVCPAVCRECSLSMRTLSRTVSHGSSTSTSDFTYVCRSSKLDVDSATLDAIEGPRKAEFEPYLVNGFLVGFIETVFSLFFLVLFLRWYVRRIERREAAELVPLLAEAEKRLAAFEAAEPGADPEGPYR